MKITCILSKICSAVEATPRPSAFLLWPFGPVHHTKCTDCYGGENSDVHFPRVTTVPSFSLTEDEGRVEGPHDSQRSCWPPLSPRGAAGLLSPPSSRTVFMNPPLSPLPPSKHPGLPRNKHIETNKTLPFSTKLADLGDGEGFAGCKLNPACI